MENEKIKNYESIVILKETNTEEEYQKALDKVKKYMEELAEIDHIEENGLRKLAYEVREQKAGYFVIFYLKAKSENIADLERKYRVDSNVLKFLTVIRED